MATNPDELSKIESETAEAVGLAGIAMSAFRMLSMFRKPKPAQQTQAAPQVKTGTNVADAGAASTPSSPTGTGDTTK
jgi:uncharacterized membrane protein YebE (DUF533 family)